MDKNALLKKAFQDLIGAQPNLPVPGVVKAVSGDHCSVQIAGGLVLTDVKLKATISEGSDYLLLTPKVNSNVLMISLTGKPDNMAVIKVDQVEKFEYSQNGLIILADSTDGKVKIKNGSVSLTKIFTSLGALLSEFKVFTNTGVSGLPVPSTITAIEQFEQEFKQLLKPD